MADELAKLLEGGDIPDLAVLQKKFAPDPAMTLAAVDRLVHHATIFEMNVEGYRRREAQKEKRTRGRPASFATIKNSKQIDAERQSQTERGIAGDN